MLVSLIATALLKRGSRKLEAKSSVGAAGAISIIPIAALTGAFVTFGIQQFQRGLASSIVMIASGLVMFLWLWIAKRTMQFWLREWGLGFSLVVGVVVSVLITNAGVA